MTETGIQVGDDPDRQRAERLRDLGAIFERKGRVLVDDEAGTGDDDHDEHLADSPLTDDDETSGEDRDKDVRDFFSHRVFAHDVRSRVLVHQSVKSGPDRDTVAEKKRIDHRIYQADGTGDDAFRLKLQRPAD